MGQQAQNQWPLGSLYADLLAMGLGTQLLRRHTEQPLSMAEAKGGLPMPRLRHALEYMTENLSRDLKLDEVAAELQLSAFHFAHEFRNSTGQTPYQYLLDQRMRRAQQLLRTTDQSVQYIASEAGFGSATNFVRAFRQRLGITPGAWRKSA